MPHGTPGQGRIPGLNVAKSRGRVRRAVEREFAAARGRGLDVSPASVTVAYVLADAIDLIDASGEDRYLLPQLAARLLEERRAANALPDKPADATDDVWTQLAGQLVGLDAPP